MNGCTEIICGDAREVLREVPERSVHCVVTSPPYWSLRDYRLEPVIWGDDDGCKHDWGEPITGRSQSASLSGSTLDGAPPGNERRPEWASMFCGHCGAWRGTLGLEPTPELYVEHIVAIFREVRRVLRDDGTLWLNMGDSYAGSGKGYSKSGSLGDYKQATNRGSWSGLPTAGLSLDGSGLKPKDLCGMPWRVAFALQADGWWLRSDIIWSKPNPMPESVTDRPTRSHEFLFLLAKSQRYFYDAKAIRGSKRGHNKWSVWAIAIQPFPGAHFATFPEKLVEPCILAGTSEWGCCPECGAPWVRVMERTGKIAAAHKGSRFDTGKTVARQGGERTQPGTRSENHPVGWRATCAHEGEPVAAVVCDPFAGSGTVGVVAARLGRRAILIDANPDYREMARQRTRQMGLMSQMTGTTT